MEYTQLHLPFVSKNNVTQWVNFLTLFSLSTRCY